MLDADPFVAAFSRHPRLHGRPHPSVRESGVVDLAATLPDHVASQDGQFVRVFGALAGPLADRHGSSVIVVARVSRDPCRIRPPAPASASRPAAQSPLRSQKREASSSFDTRLDARAAFQTFAVRTRPLVRRRWWAFAVIVVGGVLLHSRCAAGSAATTGYDASYPQCSGSYPSQPLFGIVGVNGGLASNANPCLSGELQWPRRGAPG